VQIGLRREGYAVDWLTSAYSASTAVMTHPYDLILLDLGLPRSDGLALLREMRGSGVTAPIIIITARDGLEDRVTGLDAGADDYVLKPFDLVELSARIRAVARRVQGASRAHSDIVVGPVKLDTLAKVCWVDGHPVELTAREFAILRTLMQRPGVVWSRRDLEERLFDWGRTVDSNAVEVFIFQLRRKIGREFIKTRRGLGYFVSESGREVG
jgi:two-component system, OmpR family, response regulator QseB